MFYEVFATIFTPQGDGNARATAASISTFKAFATIFTPQGDGNHRCLSDRAYGSKIRHDIYPARGRKLQTLELFLRLFVDFQIRHDIYPARGRKPEFTMFVLMGIIDSPRYLPRKGTETPWNFRGTPA